MNENNNTIALLIDAENVSHNLLDKLEEQLAMLGRITVKKCYGDFSKENMKNWRGEFVNKHALEVIQQYSFTSGKNSSDIRLAIDAMDILYGKSVTAICIMSSDSDFAGLAIRLKQSGILVWGAGETKTPDSFRKVCDRFFVLNDTEQKVASKPAKAQSTKAEPQPDPQKELENKREEIYGWVSKLILSNYVDGIDSGTLANTIRQRYPDFDWTQYGVKKFPEFLQKDPKDRFEIKKEKGHSNITIFVK